MLGFPVTRPEWILGQAGQDFGQFLGDHLQNGSPYPIGSSPVLFPRSVLSVTLVYCGKTVEQIKLKLGTRVVVVVVEFIQLCGRKTK